MPTDAFCRCRLNRNMDPQKEREAHQHLEFFFIKCFNIFHIIIAFMHYLKTVRKKMYIAVKKLIILCL